MDGVGIDRDADFVSEELEVGAVGNDQRGRRQSWRRIRPLVVRSAVLLGVVHVPHGAVELEVTAFQVVMASSTATHFPSFLSVSRAARNQ